jgi:hypothetical protein
MNTTMNITISFAPEGTAHCLWTEALPLHELDRLEITRASNIEFNNTTQHREVKNRRGKVRFIARSRSACLEWEQRNLQPVRKGSPEIRSWPAFASTLANTSKPDSTLSVRASSVPESGHCGSKWQRRHVFPAGRYGPWLPGWKATVGQARKELRSRPGSLWHW